MKYFKNGLERYFQYLAMFVCVAILGLSCIFISIKTNGTTSVGYAVLAVALLGPLCVIGKAMASELKRHRDKGHLDDLDIC